MDKTFYVFRHGETFVTKGQYLWYYPKFLPETSFTYGTKIFSASILDEGKPALHKMGEYLKNIPTDFNASSQFRRCRQTVDIINQESGKEFIPDKRLNEVLLENPWGFKNRVSNFLHEIDQKNYQSVAICTHGAVIALLASMLTIKLVGFPKPGVLLIIKGKNIETIDFNESQ